MAPMKMVRYVCTHCGKKFEAEEKEILECPACFWSTSVKREDDFINTVAPVEKKQRPATPLKLPSIPWKPILSILIFILFAFTAVKFIPPVIKKGAQGLKREKSPKTQAQTPTANPALPVAASGSSLTPEEQNILSRRVQVSADRSLNEEEQKILDARASFKTGFSERLPSQAWTWENFEEMLRQQEKFYKVPLPRSYKGKLEDHFKKTYLQGGEAFKTGDLIQARNFWVESLAVPIYADNLQKHRGVALTMIRPFINDTLSKIGAINSAVVEKQVRDKEQEVAAKYQKLISFIDEKSWKEVVSAAENLNAQLATFTNPQSLVSQPPDYPPALAKVDPDIQATLAGMLQVSPPALSDLEPMQQDINAKQKVAESFIPEKLAAQQMVYDEALENIGRSEWMEAKKKLKEINIPLEMVRDAFEKIKILNKLQTPSFPPQADPPQAEQQTKKEKT